MLKLRKNWVYLASVRVYKAEVFEKMRVEIHGSINNSDKK